MAALGGFLTYLQKLGSVEKRVLFSSLLFDRFFFSVKYGCMIWKEMSDFYQNHHYDY